MARRTSQDIANDLKKLGFEKKVVGVHSNVLGIGLVAPSPISEAEAKRELGPLAKTIINGFAEAVGDEGTFFVPTHSLNFIGSYYPLNLKEDIIKDETDAVVSRTILDDGYYNRETSPSLVGSLTQAVIDDDRSIRSEHPTHSICAIGKDADYLIKGHTPFAQPVGIHNAFAKVIGLDGVILFIGDTIKSNTSFHAYETLAFPMLAEYFVGAAASDFNGVRRLFAQTWTPSLHRDFYMEKRRPTKAITQIRKSGLLKTGQVGRSQALYFNAKEMAAYFVENVFPNQPDIMFCDKPDHCSETNDCHYSVELLKALYSTANGKWDHDKIKANMDKQFIQLLEPGEQRITY